MSGKNCLPLLLLASCLLAAGCGVKSAATGTDKDVIATVNNYTVMRDEFDSEFRDSSYGRTDTPEARQNFLNALIDRKLILQYAQKEGLDKEKSFLKTIEKFWEQSLLKTALQRKSDEIEVKVVAADWDSKRAAETKMMNDWLSELRKNARITVKDGVLKAAVDTNEG